MTTMPDHGEVRAVAAGLGFTEGPVWDPTDATVTFTDIPANSILRWSVAAGLETVTDNAHFAIGLAIDANSRLVACEHSTRRLTRYEPDGSLTVLARSLEGRVLNSTNDVIVTGSGDVLFTDPPFGVRSEGGELVGYQQGMELSGCYVFRVTGDPDGPEPVVTSMHRPNGLVMSADESILYVSDSSEEHHRVHAFDADDGAFVRERVVATLPAGVPDGMAVDTDGRLWVAGPDGAYVYDTTSGGVAGQEHPLLGVVPVPEMVTNLCFGGRDLTTLYLTATSSLYEVSTAATGVPVPHPGRTP